MRNLSIDIEIYSSEDIKKSGLYKYVQSVDFRMLLFALQNTELATIAGMLYDIYSYVKMDTKDHAHKGAVLAEEILTLLKITDVLQHYLYNPMLEIMSHEKSRYEKLKIEFGIV
jgi:hypothetical protein